MTKKLLRVNLDTNFSLLGISCHLKDFRFAWTINKHLQLEFKKSNPYIKEENQEFSHYTQELDLEPIYLFANKGQNGFIVTKMKQLDYWMLFKNTLDEKAKQNYSQCTEEKSKYRSKDKKLLYTGLTGLLQGFQTYFFQNTSN